MAKDRACDWYLHSLNSNVCKNCGFKSYEHSKYYAIESITNNEGVIIKAGDVVRLKFFENSSFGDCVILGFNAQNWAKLARPYAYVSSVGTTCASPLLGCEVFETTVESLQFDKIFSDNRSVRSY